LAQMYLRHRLNIEVVIGAENYGLLPIFWST
jgi:hypothetical protein